ncbi:alpha-amylase family glycosyl hydrolase [Thalassobacillus devorans]|uniref:alpha-amylase family glycosyl hydrolase n=1 Tax=Thalassobacillus devorans TaxID=279813 RepID=UPI000A1CCC08|nr:alpha-amylase family glycosyl hydrolase [Thalassobacillus devorans]
MHKEQLIQLIEDHLKKIYQNEYHPEYTNEFRTFIENWEGKEWGTPTPLTEENIYLIAYGDSIYDNDRPTLPVLHQFLKEEAGEAITDVHLLPMFPYTSDDGFSVTDYRKINPELGSWENIRSFSRDYRMMFDFVANHISQSSEWFQKYLAGNPDFEGFFIPEDETFDMSNVVRPRTSPLFHEYEGETGVKTAWTTFSKDQVDVNFKHFPALMEMTDVLLDFLNEGATSIRLDAIGFIWKESGTTCIHLPQAHEIIKLWNTIVSYFKPNVQIITETNVPHQENISYFGNGTDEANMVYQFSLPPLVLYSFTTHNTRHLTEWAKTITKVSDQATYFNFLASHDGIGMRPTEGILTEEEKQMLVDKVLENGGEVSYKSNPDGSQSVYELNINYTDALINQGEDDELEKVIRKTLAAHAILLSFIGVPAIYYHSLLGSSNDTAGMEESGIPRRINREKLAYQDIKQELHEDPRRRGIFNGLKQMIGIRKQQSAFSPYASQEVVDLSDQAFGLVRYNEDTGEKIFFAVNTGKEPEIVHLPFSGHELLTNKAVTDRVTLGEYEFVWILAD